MTDHAHSNRRKIFEDKLYAHFVTTSCFDRRAFFSIERASEIFQWALASQTEKQQAHLLGYVVMPDHVHFIIWFPTAGQLSTFMKYLKQRSSKWIRKELNDPIIERWGVVAGSDPIWQTRFYSFEIDTEVKLNEKLNYIHHNPVRKNYCDGPGDWKWSSARHYQTGEQGDVLISRP